MKWSAASFNARALLPVVKRHELADCSYDRHVPCQVHTISFTETDGERIARLSARARWCETLNLRHSLEFMDHRYSNFGGMSPIILYIWSRRDQGHGAVLVERELFKSDVDSESLFCKSRILWRLEIALL